MTNLFSTLGYVFKPSKEKEAPKIMPLKASTYKAFQKMNKEFSLLLFIQTVRVISKRPYVTDGSITRELRYLRADPECGVNYKVIDRKKAIYKKC